jgi:hypothetical protein
MAGRRNRDGAALSLFSDALREARHKVGLSSDELGDKLGYSGRRYVRSRAGTARLSWNSRKAPMSSSGIRGSSP